MNCRTKEEFHLEELILDIEKTKLSEKEEILLKFFQTISEDTVISNVRDAYYHRIPKEYEVYAGEPEARAFWDEVKDVAEYDAYQGKIKLSPDDMEALDDACKGAIGIGLYVKITEWFYEHGFIRSDITIWNCRLFRYLDSYLMTKENIILGVFHHYEDIGNIEEIRKEAMEFLQKRIPNRIFKILEKKIDTDEKFFEGELDKTEPTEQEESITKLVNEYLKPLAEDIYNIVFKEA